MGEVMCSRRINHSLYTSDNGRSNYYWQCYLKKIAHVVALMVYVFFQQCTWLLFWHLEQYQCAWLFLFWVSISVLKMSLFQNGWKRLHLPFLQNLHASNLHVYAEKGVKSELLNSWLQQQNTSCHIQGKKCQYRLTWWMKMMMKYPSSPGNNYPK